VNGLTALNCWSPSVMWNWCNGTTSGIDFLDFMMTGIEAGFVVPGDTIVADNYQVMAECQLIFIRCPVIAY
jgi:hypothetical protein